MRKSIILVMLICFITSGCASIVAKSSFPVSLQSNPDESKVEVKNDKGMTVFSGRTPTIVTLVSGESYFHANAYTVTFSKEGYENQQIVVKSTISGWYFGNILFGGLIGMLIVDPITGKMWKLPDTPIFGSLNPKDGSNDSKVKDSSEQIEKIQGTDAGSAINLEGINKSGKNSDMYAELMKLNDLKEKGILSEDEFNAQKQKLLQKY